MKTVSGKLRNQSIPTSRLKNQVIYHVIKKPWHDHAKACYLCFSSDIKRNVIFVIFERSHWTGEVVQKF